MLHATVTDRALTAIQPGAHLKDVLQRVAEGADAVTLTPRLLEVGGWGRRASREQSDPVATQVAGWVDRALTLQMLTPAEYARLLPTSAPSK